MGNSDAPLLKLCTAPMSEPNTPLPLTLPEELLAEVLSFLTVKSLSRFKCVSKYWYSLISNPFFVKKHLLKSSQNPYFAILPPHIMRHDCRFHPCVRNNQLTVCRLLENRSIVVANYPLVDTREESHRVIGSCCNGLICLLQELRFNDEYHVFSLRFWNPTTRSLSKKLGSFLNTFKGSKPGFQFAFGYDNLSDKYKVVAFCPNEVRVFTSGDNVWKNIQSFPIDPYSYHGNHGVYLSNSLNWFAVCNKVLSGCKPWQSRSLNLDQFFIISLDLGTETYTLLHLPQSFDEVSHAMPIVSILMNCLCFTHFTKGDEFVIWQMKEFGVEDSWTKLFQFSYQCERNIYDRDGYSNLLPLHVIENGDTLILVISEGQRGEGQLICYNRRVNRVEITGITNDIYWFFAKHYVESFESIC